MEIDSKLIKPNAQRYGTFSSLDEIEEKVPELNSDEYSLLASIWNATTRSLTAGHYLISWVTAYLPFTVFTKSKQGLFTKKVTYGTNNSEIESPLIANPRELFENAKRATDSIKFILDNMSNRITNNLFGRYIISEADYIDLSKQVDIYIENINRCYRDCCTGDECLELQLFNKYTARLYNHHIIKNIPSIKDRIDHLIGENSTFDKATKNFLYLSNRKIGPEAAYNKFQPMTAPRY